MPLKDRIAKLEAVKAPGENPLARLPADQLSRAIALAARKDVEHADAELADAARRLTGAEGIAAIDDYVLRWFAVNDPAWLEQHAGMTDTVRLERGTRVLQDAIDSTDPVEPAVRLMIDAAKIYATVTAGVSVVEARDGGDQ